MTTPTLNNDRSQSPESSPVNPGESLSLPLTTFAAQYNQLFQSQGERLTVAGRISLVLEDFPGTVIVTSSGGIQSGLLLAHLATLRESRTEYIGLSVNELPIIFLDTGDLFDESIEYMAQLKNRFGPNIIRHRHALSEEELRVNITALESAGLTPQSAFDEVTKVRPMNTILSLHRAKAWIAGNRRDQSRSRAELPYAEVQNDILKVYPMVDVTKEHSKQLISALDVPAHSLADRYRSVGNRTDTRVSDGPYEKSGRHDGIKEECGLHEAWVRRGGTLVRSARGFLTVDQMPVQRLELK
jgi:phosphoadenosine phosphosulfate reductase